MKSALGCALWHIHLRDHGKECSHSKHGLDSRMALEPKPLISPDLITAGGRQPPWLCCLLLPLTEISYSFPHTLRGLRAVQKAAASQPANRQWPSSVITLLRAAVAGRPAVWPSTSTSNLYERTRFTVGLGAREMPKD